MSEKRETSANIVLLPTVSISKKKNKNTGKLTRTLTWKIAESTSFTFDEPSMTTGIKIEIDTKMPHFGENPSPTMDDGDNLLFETGHDKIETRTESVTTNIETKRCDEKTVFIEATQYKTDLPFTADAKKIFYDGTTSNVKLSGVYKGVTFRWFSAVQETGGVHLQECNNK